MVLWFGLGITREGVVLHVELYSKFDIESDVALCHIHTLSNCVSRALFLVHCICPETYEISMWVTKVVDQRMYSIN